MLATDKFNSGGVGLQNAVLALPSGEVLLAPPGVAFPIRGDDLGCDPGWPPVHRSREAAHAWAVQPTGVGVGGQGVSCQCSWLANTPQRVICRWLAILGVMHSGKRQLAGARSWPALRFQAGRTPGGRKSSTKNCTPSFFLFFYFSCRKPSPPQPCLHLGVYRNAAFDFLSWPGTAQLASPSLLTLPRVHDPQDGQAATNQALWRVCAPGTLAAYALGTNANTHSLHCPSMRCLPAKMHWRPAWVSS